MGDTLKVLELVEPSSGSSLVRVRGKAIELMSTLPLGGSTQNVEVCFVLWDAIQQDSIENALAAAKAFLDLFKSEQIAIDSEIGSKLHKLVFFLRSQFANVESIFEESNQIRIEFMKNLVSLVQLLLQVFPGGIPDSSLSSLISDMQSVFAVSSIQTVLFDIQIKTLTLFAYISRGGSLKSLDQAGICKYAVNLLRSVPSNSIALRKELLLTIRSCFHSPDLCVFFVPHLDDLFDETVLVGSGLTSYEMLRPLAVSALADFANAVRDKIPLEKLRKVLGFFSACISDSDLPVSAQFTSVRIVLNLIDHVFNKSSNKLRKFSSGGADGSDILREILRCVTDKFSALVQLIPKVISLINDSVDLQFEVSPVVLKEKVDDNMALLTKLVGRVNVPIVPIPDLLIEGVREVRSLVRTLLLCAKMIVHCLSHRVTARFLIRSDVLLLDSLMEDSVKVAHLLACGAGFVQSAGFDQSCGQSSANGNGRFNSAKELAVACSVQEERDLIEQVASVFAVIPQVSLADLLAKRMPWLLDSIQVNSQLMALCNCLVQNPDSLPVLCEVLFGHLASRTDLFFSSLDLLPRNRILPQGQNIVFPVINVAPSMYSSGPEVAETANVMQPRIAYTELVQMYGLREASVGSVQIGVRDVIVTLVKTLSRQVVSLVNPSLLEPVVRPFVVDITFACIRAAQTDASHAAALCGGLLRYMYRLMGAGSKTQGTVRELSDLLPVIVNECLAISRTAKSNIVHSLWLEVALTIPVRLKALIPHFELVIGCLMEALESESADTVAAGLGVLESWVDGLTPDFLFPLIQGHRKHSLTKSLYFLTKPPKGMVVHTTASGNNSVRACKILGKLGARAKFTLESHNIVGYSNSSESGDGEKSPSFLVNFNGVIAEIKLDAALRKSINLLDKHLVVSSNHKTETIPVSLQESPLDAVNEVAVVPEQELLDALNLVFTALMAERDAGRNATARRIARGLLLACDCASRLVAQRAQALVSDLLLADFETICLLKIDKFPTSSSSTWLQLPALLLAAIDSPALESSVSVVRQLVNHYSGSKAVPNSMILLGTALAEKLVNKNETAELLKTLITSDPRVAAQLAPLIIDRCMHADSTAQDLPAVTIRALAHVEYRGDSSQETQVAFLNKQYASSVLKEVCDILLDRFTSTVSSSAVLAERLFRVVADHVNVALPALMCWVDPEFTNIIQALSGKKACASVFSLASFVLELRPVPVLIHSGNDLHASLASAIGRAIEFLEKEDELSLVHSSDRSAAGAGGSTPQQQQAYLLQRAALKRSISSTEISAYKAIEALKVMKLTLMHEIIGSLGTPEKLIAVIARNAFSFDPEVAASAKHALSLIDLSSEKLWLQFLFPILKEVAGRTPLGINEIVGLSHLANLIPPPHGLDEARAEIGEKLFEKLSIYLSLLRERTYAPFTANAPTWRAGVGADSVIPLAIATLECFCGLVSDKHPLIDKLLLIASQLDVSLPSTFGAGQLVSPFLLPLLPAMMKNPDRTADQLLTKIELGKFFQYVAEILSFKSSLALRKALQDKCHQMSLMDTGGVLMMRTAAASLTAVLARHDPAYLWIQFCSVSLKANGSRSLIESMIRVWENGVATLTGANNVVGTNCLCPGGIIGPMDVSNAVCSYEGRVIAWSIIQFLRAPLSISPGIFVTSADEVEEPLLFLNMRVRLLIRLATSLSLKFAIEVSPMQNWFLSEAVSLTSVAEKREIISKSIDAFSDNAISSGCKFALLKYLLIPQLEAGLAAEGDYSLLPASVWERMFAVMMQERVGDEGVLSEISRLALCLIRHKIVSRLNIHHFVRFLSTVLESDSIAAKQTAALALVSVCDRFPAPEVLFQVIEALLASTQTELWKDYFMQICDILAKHLPTLVQSNPEILSFIKTRLEATLDMSDPHVWKWFLMVCRGLESSRNELLPVCLALLKNHEFNRSFATTEVRVLVLDVAGVIAGWSLLAYAELLANFFLLHAVAGPDPVSPTNSAVSSPTLLSSFLDKCIAGLSMCVEANASLKLHDLSKVERMVQVQSSDVVRHCKQLVALNRILSQFFSKIHNSSSWSDPAGHLAQLFGLSFVSTDKAVASSFAYLLEVISFRFDPPEEILGSNNVSTCALVYRQIVLGIQAGLTVAGNNTGVSGRLRVHALNPNSPSYLVTPFMAISALIGVLRGFTARKTRGFELVKIWLTFFQPFLIKAVTQGSRSLVLGLLPQSLHAFALSGAPAMEPVPASTAGPAGAFCYPGVLQGAELAVPSLLEITRLAHIVSDIVSLGPSEEFRGCITWLIEKMGPFITFASPSHQTFAHLLNALNFTVPQQSQKPTSGLGHLITVVQLSALIRHCLGIVGRWGLGPSYSIVDDPNMEWILDDINEVSFSSSVQEEKKGLCLSLSSALVGPRALKACCNVVPVAALCIANSKNGKSINSNYMEVLAKVFTSLDGLATLASLSDPSVKRLLGFIPQTAVTSFPGSGVADDCESSSSKSGLGGLFSIASEIVLTVIPLIPSKINNSACILIGASSREQRIRAKFLRLMPQVVPIEILSRFEWIFAKTDWISVSSRMFLPLMLHALSVHADDRVALQGNSESISIAQYNWFDSLMVLAESDSEIAYSAWCDIFLPLISSLAPAKQQSVNSSIAKFLMQSFMNKQSLFKLNVVRAVLNSIQSSLPVNLLVHCARHHGTWFESLEILTAMRESSISVNSSIFEVNAAIESILNDLGEKDSLYGEYWLRGGPHCGIALMGQGRFAEARAVLETQRQQQNDQDLYDETVYPLWIEANKSLSEWGKLIEVSTELKDPELKLEIFGKSNEWGQVADIMAQFDWSCKGWSKLFAAYLALSFSDSCHTGSDAQTKQRLFLADMEASINRSFHELVSRWGVFPDPSIAEIGTDFILLAQEFVEFSEASGLVTEIRSAITGSRPGYPTPKQLLNTWRDRLPDKYDSQRVWFELLSLRMVIFRHIQQQCSVDVVASSHIAPYMQDYPWSLAKLAQVCSDENPLLAQNLLVKFQQSLSRSTDAYNQELFEALKEQVKLYLGSDSEAEWRIGLNVLNCCAISNSNSQQAAEISWMQGRLISKLGMKVEAKAALLFAVNTYPMITKAWVDLGDLIYEKNHPALSNQEEAEECLMAYMLAVTLRPSRATRLVPRMLLLAKQGGLASLAEKGKDSQPSSVWISWVTLLIKGLSDPCLEATSRALLMKLASSAPQSIFFSLQGVPGGEEILDRIRLEHPMLFAEMDQFRNFIIEIGSRHLESQRNYRKVASTLEDLRYKRISPALAKSRLQGILKAEPSEPNLTKWLKAESNRLDILTPQKGIFIDPFPVTGNMEVPGNYTRFVSVPSGSTLESMSCVKIAKVVNEYEVVMGEPIITLIGSNGLRYSFKIGLGSVDGSGMQMASLVNGLLDKYSQSKQRGLKLFCLQSIRLSGEYHMTESPRGLCSFEDIVSQEKIEESIAEFKRTVESVPIKNPEKIAFEQFDFSDSFLSDFVDGSNASDFYASSKRCAKSLAVIGMMDHLMGVSAIERPLNQWLIHKDGRLFVTDSGLRLASSSPAFSGSSASIPLRLTRNVSSLIGERNSVGSLPASMRAVADCCSRKRIGFLELLTLLSPGTARGASERMDQIVHDEEGVSIYEGINELIRGSCNSKSLASVNPKQWLPWM